MPSRPPSSSPRPGAAVPALALALSLGLALCAAALPARAVEPDEVLADPRLEARARTLSAELRCLVCQNQSIDDSNAPLARDLRLLVRERLKAGDDDRQVMAFIVARYGDFVLLKPPVKPSTYVLWLAPLLLLAAAVVAVGRWMARTGPAPASPVAGELTAEERRRLEALLADDKDADGRPAGRS